MSISAIGTSGGLSFQDLQSMQEAMRTQVASVNNDASSVVALSEMSAISAGGAEFTSDSQSSSQQNQQNQSFTSIDTTIAYQENAHRFAVDQAVLGSSIQAFTSAISEVSGQTQDNILDTNENLQQNIEFNGINTSSSVSPNADADSVISQMFGVETHQNNYNEQENSSTYDSGTSINTTLAMGFSKFSSLMSTSSFATSYMNYGGDNNQSGYLQSSMGSSEATSLAQTSAVAALYSAQNQSNFPVSASFQPVSTYV